MKRLVLLPLCIFLFSLAKATTHIVEVSNFQFSPANISNVLVGDKIRWVWVSGFHTTTADNTIHNGATTSVPSGADTWNANISANSPSFEYGVTVAGVYDYVCVPHAPGMKGTFTASNFVTPITLSSFAVTANSAKAVVKWNTMTEQNTDYFSVRRSLNGTNYTEIGKVPAAGISTLEKRYSLVDQNVQKGRYYYYTIVTVDKDKKQQFSETKILKGEGGTTKLVLTLSPNPISRPGHLMMTFNSEKEGKMSVNVINPQGQIVIRNQMQAYPGVNNGHVHMGNLAPGTYTLVCVMNGVKETHKIVFK